MKKPLIVLTGPTAVGKTKLSIALAKAVNGEIISADSMQVYRYMDVGSAKITPDEMDGVPHHLVDVLEPTEDFNIVLFQQLAKNQWKRSTQKAGFPSWWAAPDFISRQSPEILILPSQSRMTAIAKNWNH